MIDEIDKKILKELRKNCRRSARQLAKVVGISPAALLQRIKRLEKLGIIKGYSANLDYAKLGYEFIGLVRICVSEGRLVEVEKKIAKLPGVVAVYDITGDYDALAIVMCKTRDELSRLIKTVLAMPYVEKTNTSIVLNIVKDYYDFVEV